MKGNWFFYYSTNEQRIGSAVSKHKNILRFKNTKLFRDNFTPARSIFCMNYKRVPQGNLTSLIFGSTSRSHGTMNRRSQTFASHGSSCLITKV